MTTRLEALTSSFWPEAGEGTRLPSTLTLAPVLMRASSEAAAATAPPSKTHWIFPMREPSFTSRNTAALVSRLVRTQPLTVTERPSGGRTNISFMVKRMIPLFSMKGG